VKGAERKDDLEPGGAWAQSIELSFRFLFIVVFVLGIGWAVSNCREVPPDSRAIVLRFGTVVREAKAGLLVVLPRPFEQVIVLPSSDRQIELKVDTLRGGGGGAISSDPRRNTGVLLTGDMSVVRFDATLFYQITDASAYVLSSEHVAPALARLLLASAVTITAKRDLDTILVARPERNASSDAARIGREGLRTDLVAEMNRRLADLGRHGAELGVRVSRVDLVPSIPAEAKTAFDSVLHALQVAETAIAQARTQAETMKQGADQERDRILTNAQAAAQERVTEAQTRTAAIMALSQGVPGLSGDMLSRQLYQEQIAKILGRANKVFTTDGTSGARLIVPAGARQ